MDTTEHRMEPVERRSRKMAERELSQKLRSKLRLRKTWTRELEEDQPLKRVEATVGGDFAIYNYEKAAGAPAALKTMITFDFGNRGRVKLSEGGLETGEGWRGPSCAKLEFDTPLGIIGFTAKESKGKFAGFFADFKAEVEDPWGFTSIDVHPQGTLFAPPSAVNNHNITLQETLQGKEPWRIANREIDFVEKHPVGTVLSPLWSYVAGAATQAENAVVNREVKLGNTSIECVVSYSRSFEGLNKVELNPKIDLTDLRLTNFDEYPTREDWNKSGPVAFQ